MMHSSSISQRAARLTHDGFDVPIESPQHGARTALVGELDGDDDRNGFRRVEALAAVVRGEPVGDV
jgi:hypothetical protein